MIEEVNKFHSLHLEYKKKFYRFFNWLSVFSFLCVALYTIGTTENYSKTIYLILTVPLIFILANWRMKTSVVDVERFYIFLFFVLFPIRVYFTGGVNAPGLMCAIIGFMLFSFFKSIFIQLSFFALVAFCMCFFTFYGVPDVEHNLYVRSLTYMSIFLFMFCQLYFRYKLNEKMKLELVQIEKTTTEAALITTLCHEINNPLTVMILGMDRLKRSTDNLATIEMMEKNSKRLTETLNKIKTIQSKKVGLVDYSDGSQMYDIHFKGEE
jgi:hypothetical protein